MENEQKLEILNAALTKYGLSLDDYEVDYFFNAKRYDNPIMNEFEDFKTLNTICYIIK